MSHFFGQLKQITALGCVLMLGTASGQTPQQQATPVPPVQTQPAEPQAPAPNVPGGLNLNNAPLLEVINQLATDLHINYVLDSRVKGGTVTINTYGAIRDVDLRPLLETILRMNGLGMVQAGNMYRILPIGDIARQPLSPSNQIDPTKLPDDERFILNLVFLRYVTSPEMAKILTAFIGEGAQITSYDPANLLIILDNSRNMKRTLEMINLFDNDTLAGQRVKAYTVKNGKPSDISKELETVFKAISLTEKGGSIKFLPIERINTILAIAPNPGVFPKVEEWIEKLDVPAKPTAGDIDNYVYRLKYARAETLGGTLMQLYGYGGGYGMGGGGYGMGGVQGAGGGFGTSNGLGGATGTTGGFGQGGGGGFGNTLAGGNAGGLGGTATTATGVTGGLQGSDQTGQYLGLGGMTTQRYPRIVPNNSDNTIIIQGTPQHWEQIKSLLEKMDIAPRQVQIDAKIYEVDLSGAFSMGVEAFLQARGGTASGISGTQLVGSSNSGAAGALQLTAGMLVGHSRQLLAALNLSETRSKSKVISAPSVIATDSIAASILVGDEVPTIASSAVAAGVQSGGNSLFTNTIQSKSTGVGLQITARVNASGVVTMVINQNVTAPVPTTTSSIDSPSFSQRSVQTQVTVEDGDTIAIGGIIQETSTEATSGIPYLSRLPLIGPAFGNRSTSTKRTELIVFLTPRVIYDTTQAAETMDEVKSKMKNLQKLLKDQ